MLEELKNAKRVIGIKQVTKAVNNGLAQYVFLAIDADDRILKPLRTLCETKRIEVVTGATMAELGKACSIEVGAAAAAIINK
ncbi:L7Ae/L30e/S12e/Gadd45 family ribosomal protein [Pectinatus haikarae]|uniref:Large subunit ribosomal protein L7A n=1 Tax=Pectinatus haikarae TaxID=349096 RepID=A0ABT9YAN6_9FIRM|nr:ribosomal L7Ae/L30e/S12e/Gadd45 family protein [Pectinatus haikarae]MDQ0204555.1 large subunit ribosomal protein L7A [Pectinatus haikarae]